LAGVVSGCRTGRLEGGQCCDESDTWKKNPPGFHMD
jgi:hypothetical protein